MQDSTTVYRNCSLLPSEVTDSPYIFEENSEFYYAENDGKWILFCKKFEEQDRSWLKAKEAYHSGKLKSVASIKSSTSMQNPRANDADQLGVIIFHCGPSHDKEAMMDIAAVITEHVPSSHKDLFYKSDAMSATGTRKTGQTKNCLYVYSINSGGATTTSDKRFSLPDRTEPGYNPTKPNWPSYSDELDKISDWRSSAPRAPRVNNSNNKFTPNINSKWEQLGNRRRTDSLKEEPNFEDLRAPRPASSGSSNNKNKEIFRTGSDNKEAN